MARTKTVYRCSACGGESSKWAGQCPDCEAWNTLSETAQASLKASPGRWLANAVGSSIRNAADVSAEGVGQRPSGIAELDRVLGGGLVPGAVVLIGGDPGIGKSTLLLQVLCLLAASGEEPLYVTGEESLQQVVLRARRLGIKTEGLRLLAETHVEKILGLLGKQAPQTLVIDSIQTMHTDLLQSAPGSVAQVRESAAQLVRFAKSGQSTLFLVGHVTKDGSLAGPRVLEHMVDTVLYFEAEGDQRFRVIRSIKNRFGAANELGVFAMTDHGLREVTNPSAIFLSRPDTLVSGSVVTVTREGSRPMLLEIQALIDESHAPAPRRVSIGLDGNRLAMLLAVLSRHAATATSGHDVFVNVVGGVRVNETGADLPLLAAVLSSLADRPAPRDLVMFGEVGLTGEIRPVVAGEERLNEAAKHGFKRAIVPAANAPRRDIEGLRVIPVMTLGEALEKV